MRGGSTLRWLGAALACALAIGVAADASARPGGGSSFRGSSRSSSSSSGSSSSGSSWSSSGSSRSSSGSSWSSSGSSWSSSGSSQSSSSGSSSVWSSSRRDDSVTWFGESGKPRAVVWEIGKPSLYGAGPARSADTKVIGYDERSGDIKALSFLAAVGGFFVVLFLGFAVNIARTFGRINGWTTKPELPARVAESRPRPVEPARTRLEGIRSYDPDFSVVLFEDFVYALYAELHTARGAGRLDVWQPYLRPEARHDLEALGQTPVSTVVIGSMSYDDVSITAQGAVVSFFVEANYTETRADGAAQSYWTEERWELRRGPYARSRPPDRLRVFACPSCGAPLERVMGGRCGHCQQVVDNGAFDWVVFGIDVLARVPRPPMLTGTTEERGTEFPTRFDAGLFAGRAAFTRRDPEFDQAALEARVGLVFSTMQTAWSSLRWELARPYLSDNLWNAQQYWIDAYRRSGLRNVTEQARITKLELVRIASDRWYDAFTFRIHATGLDYTVRDADGAVVGGSKTKERAYTEYWTLIRSREAKGAARADSQCPSCGAPLAINAVGQCGHCQAKVTSGRFDWVLSRIEQDESYLG